MVDSDGRGRGILAPADRQYLEEGEEYGNTRQARHKRRAAIEERTRNAVLDFGLLYEHLDAEELQELFDPEGGDEDPDLFSDGIRDALSTLYLGMVETPTGFRPLFKAAIVSAINKLVPRPQAIDVTFEIEAANLDDIDLQRVADKLADGRGDELTEPEMRAFLQVYGRSDDFDPETAVAERDRQQGDLGEYDRSET